MLGITAGAVVRCRSGTGYGALDLTQNDLTRASGDRRHLYGERRKLRTLRKYCDAQPVELEAKYS